MIVRHIRPFASSKNIGLEYNQTITELPNDCHICLTDGDCMFLTSDWGKQIEDIILANPQYDLITCMTNRIGAPNHCVSGMFDNDSIMAHVIKAQELRLAYDTKCIPTTVAPGLLMIFHKSIWDKYKFKENSIIFDKQFSNDVIRGKGKIGLAKGLYLLHLYRYGKNNPRKYKAHLL